MYLCTRRKIWTSFSCLVLLKYYHVVFSQFKIPANLAQLAVSKMHCLYANAVVQPSVQHCPCYMAWKTKVHTWCRHCHLCINAPMWREKRWLQGIIDPPSYIKCFNSIIHSMVFSFKVRSAISKTTRPTLGLFVLIWMHFPCWIQIW